MKTNDLLTEMPNDDIKTKAIDLIDDALAALPKESQYGERGDVYRFILKALQS